MVRRLAFPAPPPPRPNGMVWHGVGGEGGGGGWRVRRAVGLWRNGQASQTRPAQYASPRQAINPISSEGFRVVSSGLVFKDLGWQADGPGSQGSGFRLQDLKIGAAVVLA